MTHYDDGTSANPMQLEFLANFIYPVQLLYIAQDSRRITVEPHVWREVCTLDGTRLFSQKLHNSRVLKYLIIIILMAL